MLKDEDLKRIMALTPYSKGRESFTHIDIVYNKTPIFMSPKPVAQSFVDSMNGAYHQGALFGGTFIGRNDLKQLEEFVPYMVGRETDSHTEIIYEGLPIFMSPKAVAVSFMNSLNGAYREGILFGVVLKESKDGSKVQGL